MIKSPFFDNEAYLLQRTIATGDERRSFLTEVSEDVLGIIRPVLDEASKQGDTAFQIVPWSQWWVTLHPARDGEETGLPGFTCGSAARLEAGLWFNLTDDGPPPAEPPHILMAVWFGKDAPILEVESAGLLRVNPSLREDASLQAVDIARCVAWSWLVEIKKVPIH